MSSLKISPEIRNHINQLAGTEVLPSSAEGQVIESHYPTHINLVSEDNTPYVKLDRQGNIYSDVTCQAEYLGHSLLGSSQRLIAQINPADAGAVIAQVRGQRS